MASTRTIFWGAFAVFVVCAFATRDPGPLLVSAGPLSGVKLSVWAAWLAFLAYTVLCSARENLFTSMGAMAKLYWGRQVGADLYLGLALMIFVVYLNEGSLGVALLWLLPALVFVNLATLLYLALHFDALVARFLP